MLTFKVQDVYREHGQTVVAGVLDGSRYIGSGRQVVVCLSPTGGPAYIEYLSDEKEWEVYQLEWDWHELVTTAQRAEGVWFDSRSSWPRI